MQPPDDETTARSAKELLEGAYQASASLPPNDRLRLIVRLWSSLPPDHWAAPTPEELAEVARKLSDLNSRGPFEAPWEVVRDVLDLGRPVHTGPKERIYSATRRFDLAAIFALTVLYSLLLGGFRGVTHFMDLNPIWIALAGIFVTVVGVAQALLFGGKDPRPASVYAGAGAWFFCCIIYAVSVPRAEFSPVLYLFTAIFFGAPLGYLAGVLVGGTFLLADVVRKRYRRFEDEPQSDAPRANVHPLDVDEDDPEPRNLEHAG